MKDSIVQRRREEPATKGSATSRSSPQSILDSSSSVCDTQLRLQQLRSTYALLTRRFEYHRTGAPSNYGLSGTEFQLHGGFNARTQKQEPSPLHKLDAFLTERDLDPETYLSIAFRNWSGPRPPLVDQLASERALQAYRRYETTVVPRLIKEKETYYRAITQQTHLNQHLHGMSPADASLSAVLEPRIEVRALYRYCILLQTGRDTIAQRYQASALIEYAPFRTHYDNAWSELIPASLRAAAIARRARLGEQ